MLYFCLWAGMLKTYSHIFNQHPPSFMQKLEFFNFEPKMPFLGVLGSNYHI